MSSANRLAECVKPVVEQLEGRTLMSITISPLQMDSEGHIRLFIRGDSKNDTIHIEDDPGLGEVRITANGHDSTIAYPGGPGEPNLDPGNEIELFDVNLGGGNDTIIFETEGDPTGPVYTGEHRSLHLDGDSGNDTITCTIPGGITAGSEIAVDVDGQSGNDKITLNFDSLTDSKLDIDDKDGEGNDTTLINAPTLLSSDLSTAPNYSSVCIIDANTGNGKNSLQLNANSSVYYDGVMDIHVVGGNSTGSSYDTINLDLENSVVEGKMFVDVNALNGDDRINMRTDGLYVETEDRYTPLTYAPAPTLVVNLNGNDGKDQINSIADTNGFYVDETGFLSFNVKGGNGDDKLSTMFTGPIDVAFGGQLMLNIDGQNNKDTIETQLSFADSQLFTSTGGGGQVTLQILGGQNEDNFKVLLTDLSTNGIAFGPGAFGAVIDGQSNTDKIFAQFTNLVKNPLVRNFESSTIAILP
jgi:hypothetical protein